ncbi:S8 family serine peptidase [Brevibacillus sp. WF146]|uniref:S8 family serine peptidase n=1 Tax=Brevibacillus sp. WF146 TaxID=319501 RepID=UPI0007EE19E6|nr:S8 family serine peptidase [Brevibacillus sp. WF146]
MRLKWHAALSATLVVSLMIGQLPASAKRETGRKGSLAIEAKEGLSLASQTSQKRSTELVVVQFDGPVEEEWKEQVEDLGVTLGDYIPDYAFIARVDGEKAQRALKKLSFVRNVLPFHPVSKVSPTLRSTLGKRADVDVAVIGFDRGVDMGRTLRRIVEEGDAEQVKSLEEAPHISMARLSGRSLEEVIQSDEVIAVVPVPERKQRNDRAAAIIRADDLASTGYTGEGQIVGVADSGLDTGDLDRIHPDFEGRVKELYAIGRKGDASDPDGHGTHVAGSIVGTGKASDGQYKGMAPDAKLVFHSMLDEYGYLAGDVSDILEEAYADGARIHSDSWGVDDDGEYGLDSFLFDQFLWEHPDMTALVAAGNAGIYGYETIGTPATAKNVIAVGASENDRPELDEDEADDPDEVAAFSSRGTTADGRLKPDLVAPGSYILSTRSSLAPDENFHGLFNAFYAYLSGTSMATPVLAGGVAQVRQFLQENGVDNPSGALIKAMLISGADDLNEDMRVQGFGRANLRRAIETGFVDEKKGLKTGDVATYRLNVTDDSQPLAITLAWTDYPASLAAERTLVNNLNLRVVTPSGETLNGNDFFHYPYDDEVDNLNNVEQVWIKHPEEGVYTVTVEGYNVPMGPQPYALAANGELVSDNWQTVVKTGRLIEKSRKNRDHTYWIQAKKAGELNVTAEWDGDADLDLYVYDGDGNLIGSTDDEENPETLTVEMAEPGPYRIVIQLEEGKLARYRLQMTYPSRSR